jgi:hypothetical protein
VRSRGYQIIDEPRPGALARIAVDPLWPFLGLLMGGPWLGFPWFVLNALAIGSAAFRKELFWAIGGLVGLVVVCAGVVGTLILLGGGKAEFGYLRFIPIVWLMGCGYVLHLSQARSAQLFAYFGGRIRVGWPVVILGAVVVRPWLGPELLKLPAGWFIYLVLG